MAVPTMRDRTDWFGEGLSTLLFIGCPCDGTAPEGEPFFDDLRKGMKDAEGISQGKWFLRGRDKIVVRHDPKKSDEEIITVLRVEPYFDHTFLYVRYQNGSREKWMK